MCEVSEYRKLVPQLTEVSLITFDEEMQREIEKHKLLSDVDFEGPGAVTSHQNLPSEIFDNKPTVKMCIFHI